GVIALFLLGVSLGADGGKLTGTFPGLSARAGHVTAHLALAPGMFRRRGEAAGEERAKGTRKAAEAAGRGALLGLPVMLVVGALLAQADPVFLAWFNLPSLALHLVLLCAGAWIVLGLVRAASAVQPAPGL